MFVAAARSRFSVKEQGELDGETTPLRAASTVEAMDVRSCGSQPQVSVSAKERRTLEDETTPLRAASTGEAMEIRSCGSQQVLVKEQGELDGKTTPLRAASTGGDGFS
jgi:hypothetical protein